MKILKKLSPYAKMSFVLGHTSSYDKGTVDINDNVCNHVYDSMISAIRVDSSEIDVVALRNQYKSGFVYPQYDDKTNEPYHVTNDDNVYICLSNNNGAVSTQPPTGTLLNNIIRSDGYVWAFIGKVNDVDLGSINKYITIPTAVYKTNEVGSISRIDNIVSTSTNFDKAPKYKIIGSGTNAVFDISLDGVGNVNYIACANGGFGYGQTDIIAISDNFDGTGAEVNLKVVDGKVQLDSFTNGTGYNECSILIVGDGTGALADFTTLSGSVTDVSIIDEGEGYTWAKAVVFSSERAILAQLKLLSLNGKATDPSVLMRANTWRIKKTLDVSTMEGYVYDGMKFNLISVVEQYNDQYVAGVNNRYNGNAQLNRATEVKEVYAVNKIDEVIQTQEDKINLILTIKLDG